MTPPLTVLMAVRNGGPYVRTAVQSMLDQTYSDFLFLIVDDASTDDTREIVRGYGDPRIELLPLASNVGQTEALNVGLRHATTPWIARIDADDYSAPARLEEQVRALAADSSLGCVGTFAWEFRDDPAVVDQVITKPQGHDDIARALLEGSPIIHGSIVVSRAALVEAGAYDARYRYSADLELYDRLLRRCRAANLPRQLLGIRRHPGQGSYSRVALDEKIEIFSRMLAARAHDRAAANALRASLCFCYLFGARNFAARQGATRLAKDLWNAWRVSPRQFLRLALRTARRATA